MNAGRQNGGVAAPARVQLLCPYCGSATPQGARCAGCRGLLDPLSRQASQNAMGPWFVRDAGAPFMPGCSYETLVGMVKRGKITKRTVLRGPTTRQFWCTAERTPGVSHFLGVCHNCRVDVQPTDSFCDECGAGFTVETDRQHLGLGPIHLLPGQAPPEAIAGADQHGGGERTAEAQPETVPPGPDPGVAVVRALHDTVRRQRRIIVVMVLLALGVGAAVVWLLVPRDRFVAWLDSQGIRFSAAPAAPRAAEQAPTSVNEPAAAPGVVPAGAGGPVPGTDAATIAPGATGPESVGGAPEPASRPAGEEAAPAAGPRALDAASFRELASTDSAAVLEEAAARARRSGDERLAAALERRRLQVRLRGFP